MKLSTLKKRLLNVGKFQVKKDDTLQKILSSYGDIENTNYNLVYFVSQKNKIIFTRQLKLYNKPSILNKVLAKLESLLKKYNVNLKYTSTNYNQSVLQYIKRLNNIIFEQYSTKDLNEFEYLIYIIPKKWSTRNALEKVISEKNNHIHGFKSSKAGLLRYLKKNYQALLALATIIAFVYTGLTYFILSDVGIPTNTMNEVNVIVTLLGLFGIVILATTNIPTITILTIVVLLLYTDINYQNKIFIILGTIIALMYLFSRPIIKEFIFGISKIYTQMGIGIFLLFISILPVTMLLDRFLSSQENRLNYDYYIYNIFKEVGGFPKIMIKDETKYLLVGVLNNTYQLYNLNTILLPFKEMNITTEYIKKVEKILADKKTKYTIQEIKNIIINLKASQMPYVSFCNNINYQGKLSKDDKNRILFYLLRNSEYLKNSNYEIHKIEDKMRIIPFSIETILEDLVNEDTTKKTAIKELSTTVIANQLSNSCKKLMDERVQLNEFYNEVSRQ